MKQRVLSIEINRPCETVFNFLIDPDHSPDWIDSFKSETAAPWPPRVGTIYRNSNHQDEWTEYRVEAFKPPRHFGLVQMGGDYHAEYVLSSPTAESTLLKYHEWVEEGEIDKPFTIEPFEKLKAILEARA